MEIVKPKLSLDGQIEHLKEKGVLFNIMDEAEARDYLGQHNNYFKLYIGIMRRHQTRKNSKQRMMILPAVSIRYLMMKIWTNIKDSN